MGFMNIDKMKNSFKKSWLFFFAAIIIFILSSGLPGVNKDLEIEKKVEALLAQITLYEKIGQMSLVRHFEDNIDNDIAGKFIGGVIHSQGPLPGENAVAWQARFTELQKKALSTRLGIPLLIGVDAVHGQNTFEGATIFPHNIGLGAAGNEKLAVSTIRGFQGSLSDPDKVMATAKHYIGDGATDDGIEGGNTIISMQEISERLLAPYLAAVNEGVGAVMVSFNSTHSVFMHAHKELITDTLKNGMGFNGIVVTDCRGYSRFGENDIINAGVDIVMVVEGDLDHFQKGLKNGVDSGFVSLDRIDDAVRRILRQKFRIGLFDNPFADTTLIDRVGIQANREKAWQAVLESLVLLKNESTTLPIDKDTKKIVVVGEHANNSGLQSGGWSINWRGTQESYAGSTTILQGIEALAAGKVMYDEHATGNHFDADVAIIVVGETPYTETFGDLWDGGGCHKLTLREEHQDYITSYVNQGVKVMVLLVSGRPLVTTRQIAQADAFVAAWLPGSGSAGIADVLFGDYNFTGKLPHS
jgi:beta-glucosidase